MIRVDLLAPERSSVSKAIVAVLRSAEIRNALLVPLFAVAAVFSYNGYQHAVLNDVTTQVNQQQELYRALIREEVQAKLRAANYDKLTKAAMQLFGLRRSIAVQATHLKTIGNIVFLNDLRLTTITEKGDEGDQWDLMGSTIDLTKDRTCFSNVAMALPAFVVVKSVTGAVPANTREQRTGSNLCNYLIHLTFDERNGG